MDFVLGIIWLTFHMIGLAGLASVLMPWRFADRMIGFAVGVAATMVGMCWGAHFFPGE